MATSFDDATEMNEPPATVDFDLMEKRPREKIEPDRFATPQEPLRPYDAGAACPKCGATGAGTLWRPGTVRISRALGLTKADGPAEPGWLHRTCTYCGYDWAEAPVDAS